MSGIGQVSPYAADSLEPAALGLLRRCAAPHGLLRHSGLVAAAAGELALLCFADRRLSVAAGWVHDVGKTSRCAAMAVRLSGMDPQDLARLDHARLGGLLLRALGGQFTMLAPIVERHLTGAMLRGPAPVTLEEQIVHLADKLVGSRWLGLKGRLDDLRRRYGHLYDIELCVPGTEELLLRLASRACLGRADLERLTRLTVDAFRLPAGMLPAPGAGIGAGPACQPDSDRQRAHP